MISFLDFRDEETKVKKSVVIWTLTLRRSEARFPLYPFKSIVRAFLVAVVVVTGVWCLWVLGHIGLGDRGKASG